jgi:hypothetical protein
MKTKLKVEAISKSWLARFKMVILVWEVLNGRRFTSSLGRYVFGSEISYNKAPPRLPGLGC